MNNKNILVTGGYGFIGSNFINYLIDNYEGFNLINVDKYGVGAKRSNVKKPKDGQTVEHVEKDICYGLLNDEKVNLPFDYVFHFAAESHVDRSIDGPKPFVESNVVGTTQLLEDCKNMGVKKIIFISTDEVYGSVKKPTKEFSKYNPSSAYSASKASAELICNAYKTTHGMDIVTTRCSNNFGPNQFEEKLIPKVIKNALNDEKIPVYDEGLQVREWTYVDEHIADLIFVAEHGKKGETYNVGRGYEINNITLVKKILKLLDKSEDLIYYIPNARKGHDFKYSINLDKINKLRKSVSEQTFHYGEETFDVHLKRTVEHYKSD